MFFKIVLPILEGSFRLANESVIWDGTKSPAKVKIKTSMDLFLGTRALICHGENQLDSAICYLKIHVDNTYVTCTIFWVLFICSSVFLSLQFKLGSLCFLKFSIFSHSEEKYFDLLFPTSLSYISFPQVLLSIKCSKFPLVCFLKINFIRPVIWKCRIRLNAHFILAFNFFFFLVHSD